VSSKIKAMGLMGSGNCSYSCSFEKDVLYPNDSVKLTLKIDNSKCSKKIEKYKVKLIRRTQAYNLQSTKPIYNNDEIIVSDKRDAKCEAKSSENFEIDFKIPPTIFLNKSEEELFNIPPAEKPLTAGPSSSVSGRLYKVQYTL
jgi:sporulation-control protein spo0M